MMGPFLESFFIEEPSSTLFPLPSQYLSSSMRSHLDDDRHGSDYYYYFEGNHEREPEMASLDESEAESRGMSSDYGSYAVYALCGQTKSFLPFIAKNESISLSISTAIKLPKSRTKKSIRFSDHLSSILYFRSSLPVLNLLDASRAATKDSLAASSKPISVAAMPETSPGAVMKFCNFSVDDLRRSSLSLRLLSNPCLIVTLEKMELVVESLPLPLSFDLTPSLFLVGSILVRNLHYEKYVFIRLTFDHWRSFNDYPAYYSKSFRQGEIDAFDFRVHVKEPFLNDNRSTPCFAICYRVAGTQYWDNNQSNNYRIEIERSRVIETTNRVEEDEETCIFPFIEKEATARAISPAAALGTTATELFTVADFQPVVLSTAP